MSFSDRVIWITGASGGIGEALAVAFSEGTRLPGSRLTSLAVKMGYGPESMLGIMLCPEISPYAHGMIEVADGNRLYWEQCGQIRGAWNQNSSLPLSASSPTIFTTMPGWKSAVLWRNSYRTAITASPAHATTRPAIRPR